MFHRIQYRVVTNGMEYEIETRSLFCPFWTGCNQSGENWLHTDNDPSIGTYPTKEEAEKAIIKFKHQNSGWHPA